MSPGIGPDLRFLTTGRVQATVSSGFFVELRGPTLIFVGDGTTGHNPAAIGAPNSETRSVTCNFQWGGEDSNLRPTDYEFDPGRSLAS